MTYPRLFELLKAIAFVAMLIDHVDMILLHRSQPWMWAIGRIAFPIFVFTFAFGCAYAKDPVRTGFRVLVAAVVAQVAWHFAMPGYGANVLFVMALAVLASLGTMARPWPWLVVFAVYLAFVGHIEGGVLGGSLVIAGLVVGRHWRQPLAVGPHWLFLLIWRTPYGYAPSCVVRLLHAADGLRMPRLGRALLWAYPAHIAAFGAAAALLPS